jgi:hypothetical protein
MDAYLHSWKHLREAVRKHGCAYLRRLYIDAIRGPEWTASRVRQVLSVVRGVTFRPFSVLCKI